MKLKVNDGGFEKIVNLVKKDYYCPFCSAKDVYDDIDSDDYYLGSSSYCLKCNMTFNIPCSNTFQIQGDVT